MAESTVDATDKVIKPGSEDLVAIVNQESWFSSVAWECLEHLTQRPGRPWIRGDVEVDDSPTVVTQDHEAIQKPEECRRDDDEVTSGSGLHVVLQEDHPSLTGSPSTRPNAILVDGGFGDLVPEKFELQLDITGLVDETLQSMIVASANSTLNEVRQRSLQSIFAVMDNLQENLEILVTLVSTRMILRMLSRRFVQKNQRSR